MAILLQLFSLGYGQFRKEEASSYFPELIRSPYGSVAYISNCFFRLYRPAPAKGLHSST